MARAKFEGPQELPHDPDADAELGLIDGHEKIPVDDIGGAEEEAIEPLLSDSEEEAGIALPRSRPLSSEGGEDEF